MTHILDGIKGKRNLGLFSATISREVMDISWVYQSATLWRLPFVPMRTTAPTSSSTAST